MRRVGHIEQAGRRIVVHFVEAVFDHEVNLRKLRECGEIHIRADELGIAIASGEDIDIAVLAGNGTRRRDVRHARHIAVGRPVVQLRGIHTGRIELEQVEARDNIQHLIYRVIREIVGIGEGVDLALQRGLLRREVVVVDVGQAAFVDDIVQAAFVVIGKTRDVRAAAEGRDLSRRGVRQLGVEAVEGRRAWAETV